MNLKTAAHGSGNGYCIRQEALPAGSAERLESTANSRAWRLMKDRATGGAKLRLYPDNDRADRAGDRDRSLRELTTNLSH